MKRYCLIILTTVLLMVCGKVFAEEMTLEKLVNSVKQNLDSLHSLRVTIETTYTVNGNTIKQNTEIIYRKPNRFKMVALSTSGVSLFSAASDGKDMYTRSNVLNRDENIRKQKPEKCNEYFPFKLAYYFDYATMFEKILNAENLILTKEEGQVYKIRLDSERPTEKNELWIDYDKGIITKYHVFYGGSKIKLEVKEIGSYGKSFFPIRIINEKKISKYIFVTEMNWNIMTKKDIGDKEFKIESQER